MYAILSVYSYRVPALSLIDLRPPWVLYFLLWWFVSSSSNREGGWKGLARVPLDGSLGGALLRSEAEAAILGGREAERRTRRGGGGRKGHFRGERVHEE